MNNNLYEVLEISQSASDEEIKYAYRKLSMKYHPDRTSGDTQATEKFKEIKNAYEVLSDPSKRSYYDATGQTSDQGSSGTMEDIFSQFMGGGFSSAFNFSQASSRQTNFDNVRSPGDDVQFNLQVSLHTVLNGYKVVMGVPTKYPCSSCRGSGSLDSNCKKQTCDFCKGSGMISMQHGPINIRQTCPKCNGQRFIISNPCPSCQGSGFEVRQEEYQVEVKATKI